MKHSKTTANKIQRFVNSIYSEMSRYFNELLDQYNLSKNWNKFILYNTIYRDKVVDDLAAEKRYNRMMTASYIYADPKSENFGTDECIIEEVEQTVYMSYQAFYEIIVGCMMNYDDIIDSMKFTLRHEVGHILYNRTFIGKTVGEWYSKIDQHKDEEYKVKLPRKNASMNNRLKYILEYNKLPEEVEANNRVGITEEEIINDFYKTNGW